MKLSPLQTLRNIYGVKKGRKLLDILEHEELFEEIAKKRGKDLIIQYKSENNEAVCDFIGGELSDIHRDTPLSSYADLIIGNINYYIKLENIIDITDKEIALADTNMNLIPYQFLSAERTIINVPAKNPFEAYWRLREAGKVPKRATLVRIIRQQNTQQPGKPWSETALDRYRRGEPTLIKKR